MSIRYERTEYRVFVHRGDQRAVVLETENRDFMNSEVAEQRRQGATVYVTMITHSTRRYEPTPLIEAVPAEAAPLGRVFGEG